MPDVNLWYYLAIVGLIVLSAFFSGSEIAYASSNSIRLKKAAEEKKSLAARLAYYIHERYEEALTAILIGNNLVNIAASSIFTLIVLSLLGEGYSWVSTLSMTLLLLLFGEITPKVIANQISEGFATLVSIPLRAIMWITKPLTAAIMFLIDRISRLWAVPEGPTVTEDDLENFIDTAEDEGVIDEERSDLLQNALDFDEVLAYEIITPRVDMVAIDIDDPYEEIMYTIHHSPYSRLPVYEDSVDNIIGILHLNHVLKELVNGHRVDIRSMLMPVHFVHKTMPLPDVLTEMKRHKSHLYIVTDEYGGTMGLLTMEDVLEQLVGEIWDESDLVEDEFVEVGERKYDVSGDMRIEDFFEELDIDDRDFEDDNATVGGWAIEMIGRYPRAGESFTYKNLTVTIKKLKRHRVDRLIVTAAEVPQEEDWSDI